MEQSMLSSDDRPSDAPQASPYAGLDRLSELNLEVNVDDGSAVMSDEELQAAFVHIIKMYARKFERGSRALPYVDPSLSATNVLITTTMLLKAANVELFELGMWQSFSGIK